MSKLWIAEYEAITKVIVDRVVARLETFGYKPQLQEGKLRFIDETWVSLNFDYNEDRSRKFTIDAAGARILKGREGKFAYKDMTVDVNYEQLVGSLVKQVETEKGAKKDALARANLRAEIDAVNAKFGCARDDSNIWLRLYEEDDVQLVLPTFKTVARARQFLEALYAAGLLVPASEKDDSEVQVAHSS